MKTVLLTEEEYRKVCQILNEKKPEEFEDEKVSIEEIDDDTLEVSIV
ncbi:MAG: hypothetical protein MJZ34_04850 [Paludibacteraceae bacterium]|nr:hypothetical protein [Paludibacteraceae bacterium]